MGSFKICVFLFISIWCLGDGLPLGYYPWDDYDFFGQNPSPYGGDQVAVYYPAYYEETYVNDDFGSVDEEYDFLMKTYNSIGEVIMNLIAILSRLGYGKYKNLEQHLNETINHLEGIRDDVKSVGQANSTSPDVSTETEKPYNDTSIKTEIIEVVAIEGSSQESDGDGISIVISKWIEEHGATQTVRVFFASDDEESNKDKSEDEDKTDKKEDGDKDKSEDNDDKDKTEDKKKDEDKKDDADKGENDTEKIDENAGDDEKVTKIEENLEKAVEKMKEKLKEDEEKMVTEMIKELDEKEKELEAELEIKEKKIEVSLEDERDGN